MRDTTDRRRIIPATERDARIAEAVIDLTHRGDDFDVVELLHDLTGHATALLTVQCAGITIINDRGRVAYATASDERCRELEEIQVELGEGPCLDSTRSRGSLGPVAFGDDSLGTARWPRFALHAHRAGIVAIAAVPLRSPETSVGALNTRVAIEQAKGVLTERFGISMDEAFTRLRDHARARRIPLSDLAVDVALGHGPTELEPTR
ncbi:GAF and ANTAR domain-containing protein [Amycolatopsis oliviviridis]|uniref:Transcriptional regulator n=1 Tax=Amycolatopsis oliviviridis TaxID=1471590 RepID=A0ABQ3LYS0_9PSEU|nr:ANTAR domain-containing protein [Amycolatopsis oliviviridis]GHH28638.1 transcriptional regulator [Amycolatopsis oliviviridis]